MDADRAYNQALDYLYSFIDYSREKTAILAKAEFKLERMVALLELLGNPQNAYPTFHVGGTKGKGSTCALIASALSAAGYKTGLYISPHLQEYTERIQVDGKPIPAPDLVQLVEEVKPSVVKVPELTTFEITTALGFLYFARQKVDAAVIEVGMGGRLDATNVITPRVSVITSLSYDHMAVLGDTLTLIAGEKAGIIKPGVPLVSSPQAAEALKVLERVAKERGAALTLVGREVKFEAREHSIEGQTLAILDHRMPPKEQRVKIKKPVILRIPLLGRHQVENATTAWAALQVAGIKVPASSLRAGFLNVKWQCRFEVARREPPVIFDSAHNQDSFRRLCETLEDYFPGRPVILLMGASEDKNLRGMLEEIKPKLHLLIAIRADHPRALAPQAIVDAAERLELRATPAVSVGAALEHALELSAAGGEILLSAGSMFATAEVKMAWQKRTTQKI